MKGAWGSCETRDVKGRLAPVPTLHSCVSLWVLTSFPSAVASSLIQGGHRLPFFSVFAQICALEASPSVTPAWRRGCVWDRQCPVAQWPLSDAVPWQPLGSSAVAVTAGTLLALGHVFGQAPASQPAVPPTQPTFWGQYPHTPGKALEGGCAGAPRPSYTDLLGGHLAFLSLSFHLGKVEVVIKPSTW